MNGGWSPAAIVGAGVIPAVVIAVETLVFCAVQIGRAVRDARRIRITRSLPR